ncbi:MAG: hypothetical protein ACE5H5_00930 [Nitrospinota bacterium]
MSEGRGLESGKILYSFQRIHGYRGGGSPASCTEAAYAAAALLRDDGFPPLVVWFIGPNAGSFGLADLGHMFYLVKMDGKYGTLGATPAETFYPPPFERLEDLVRAVGKAVGIRPRRYGVLHLDRFHPGWEEDRSLFIPIRAGFAGRALAPVPQ